MKTAYLILFITTVVCYSCNNEPKESTVDVQPFTNSQQRPEHNLAGYKPFKVVVSHAMLMGNGYEVIYYPRAAKPDFHIAFYGSEEDFNKAGYNWLNDTTVSIRLYNSTTNKEAKFKAYGGGSRNSMEMDKK